MASIFCEVSEDMQTKNSNNSNYDQLFLERYDDIYKWALQLTKFNHELSEDLVHSTYVRFRNLHENSHLSDINNIDGYLYITLKNSYISYLRKNQYTRELTAPMVASYKPISDIIFMIDPREQIKVRDELLAICYYACLRKDSSISSSILLLRFFHGYYPSEIARILKSARNAVEARLLSARKEAVAYLNNPDEFDYISRKLARQYLLNIQSHSSSDLLQNLRLMIFKTKRGTCFHPTQIREMYMDSNQRINRKDLSHLVGCVQCLSETNKYLGLADIEDRHPLYVLGREQIFEEEKALAHHGS